MLILKNSHSEHILHCGEINELTQIRNFCETSIAIAKKRVSYQQCEFDVPEMICITVNCKNA